MAVLDPGDETAVDVVLVLGRGRRDDVLTAFAAARRQHGQTPLVGIWPDHEAIDERGALRAGVNCLVRQSDVSICLEPALYAACYGLVCLPRRPSTAERMSALSEREREVLLMLVGGATNAQIGRELFLAESTVKSHVSSAYAKLGVRSRKDAAALLLDRSQAVELGMLASRHRAA
jgi:DNA-binding NarL/FixJ family response regulator